MRRSWSQEKSFYPLILCCILILHLVSLFLEFSFDESKPQVLKETPLVITIDPPASDVRRQIVDSEEADHEEVKDEAFLSDKTRSFERQTKAQVVDSFQSGKSAGGKKKQKENLKLSDLGHSPGEDPYRASAQEYNDKKNGKNIDAQEEKISSTSDYLKDIPPGDLTNLNTVEYKYYGFYHRIRQKLEQFWGRSLHEKAEEMAGQGRRVPSSEDLITALRITLDERGEIIEIKILGSSGIRELDDAAIESFNEAGPFPNPPKDLIVNGKVTLEWGFVVQS